MSPEEKKAKKKKVLSAAAVAKNPQERVQELMKEFEGDRKKAALKMQSEVYRVGEIEHAFKKVTTKGIGSQVWKRWKDEGKAREEVGEVAGPVREREEKAWMTTVLAKFKTLTDRLQAHVMDYGIYVLETVTPQVPADLPEDKVGNTRAWLTDAVTAYQPEKLEEIEKFGAAAFLAALEVKRQMRVFMDWAEPSKRLENLAEKALYSPNPLNMEAFKLLLNNLMTTIHAVPRFERGPKREELPGIVKAYARARGIPEELAEHRMETVIKEVA